MSDTVYDAPLDTYRLEELGLTRQPFADHGFLFSDESTETRLNLALHLLQATGRLVLISGPAGIGRSTFLRQVATRATGLVCTGVSGDAETDLPRLLSGLDSEGPTGVLERLRGGSPRYALLLDDADLIPRTVLTELIACHETVTMEGLEWPMVLACREESLPELERLLLSHGYDENLTETLHLPPFTEQQTHAYLQERLAAAGDAQGTLLDDRQIRRIHQRGAGIPARIHVEARQVLSGDGQRGGFGLPAMGARSRPLLTGVTIALLCAVVGLPLLWWLSREPTPPASTPLELTPQREFVGAFGDEPQSTPPPQTETREFAAAEGDGEAALPPVAAYPGDRDAGDGSAPTAERNETESVLAQAAEADEQPEDPAPLLPDPGSQPQPASGPVPVDEPVAEPESPPSVQQDPVASAPPRQAPDKPVWLTERDPNHYTLQLIGGRERATVDRFFSQVGRDERLHVVEGQRDGNRWLVVVTGDFPSAGAARQALESLPEPWRQYGAFPRSFASLQR